MTLAMTMTTMTRTTRIGFESNLPTSFIHILSNPFKNNHIKQILSKPISSNSQNNEKNIKKKY